MQNAETLFARLVDELERGDEKFSTTLYTVCRSMIFRRICRWCALDWVLKGREYEEDMFNDIFIKVLISCVPSFFRRGGESEPVNKSFVEFSKWLSVIAYRYKIDFALAKQKELERTNAMEYDDLAKIPDSFEEYQQKREQRIERLSKALDIVFAADIGIYKVLSWLAQGFFMLEYNVTKIQATNELVNEFEDKTLSELRDIVFDTAQRISWVVISKEHKARIESALAEPFDEVRRYGEVKYGEFFMKKGGNYSVSDWVNRINKKIKREIGNGTLNG